ncbi:hypothetical protein [Aquabacterium olei]|nr:hypothetical protein [Aquabacterium olei]
MASKFLIKPKGRGVGGMKGVPAYAKPYMNPQRKAPKASGGGKARSSGS